jgi:hypothetical protein
MLAAITCPQSSNCVTCLKLRISVFVSLFCRAHHECRSGGIAPRILNVRAGWGGGEWLSFTPRQLYPRRKRPLVPTEYEDRLAPETVWMDSTHMLSYRPQGQLHCCLIKCRAFLVQLNDYQLLKDYIRWG